MSPDRYFDVVYAALNVLLFSELAATVVTVLVPGADSAARRRRPAAALCAAGIAVALVGGLVADGTLKSTDVFQQVRFGAYYAGFALILLGHRAALRAVGWRWRLLACGMVAGLLVAVPLLVVPATFVLNRYGEQVQLPVYWAPMLAVSGLGVVVLLRGSRSVEVDEAGRLLGVFDALVLLGLLRESGIIPDLGDGLVNLLVAFVPFTAAGAILVRVAWLPTPARRRPINERATVR